MHSLPTKYQPKNAKKDPYLKSDLCCYSCTSRLKQWNHLRDKSIKASEHLYRRVSNTDGHSSHRVNRLTQLNSSIWGGKHSASGSAACACGRPCQTRLVLMTRVCLLRSAVCLLGPACLCCVKAAGGLLYQATDARWPLVQQPVQIQTDDNWLIVIVIKLILPSQITHIFFNG